MKHDPLCPPDWWLPGDEEPCAYCGLIARVRAQEETSDRNVILASECEKRIAEARTAMTDFQQGVKAGYATRLTDVDDLVREAKADMLAKCIEALEDDSFHDPDPSWSGTHWNNAVFECKEALRALQEMP